MKKLLPLPIFGALFRYVGPGPASGLINRVLSISEEEIVTVHEALLPRYSWLGNGETFRREFVFLTGPPPTRHRH